MQFENQEEAAHKAVRRSIEAALETGNFDRARMLLTEYEDVSPEAAHALRQALVPVYGTSL